MSTKIESIQYLESKINQLYKLVDHQEKQHEEKLFVQEQTTSFILESVQSITQMFSRMPNVSMKEGTTRQTT
jgi:hypothetical protein